MFLVMNKIDYFVDYRLLPYQATKRVWHLSGKITTLVLTKLTRRVINLYLN